MHSAIVKALIVMQCNVNPPHVELSVIFFTDVSSADEIDLNESSMSGMLSFCKFVPDSFGYFFNIYYGMFVVS